MKINWMIFFVFAIFMTHQPSHAQENIPTACDFTAIEQAIADANETGSGVIVLDCTEPIVFDYRLEVMSNIVIDGGGVTILDGRGERPLYSRGERSFFSVSEDASLTLIGITLQNGREAIYNYGVLTVINSHFIGNQTTFYGGAIVARGMNLTIVNSTFSDNISYGYGGAISVSDATVFIFNSTFTNNVGHTGGGAIHLGLSARGHIYNSNFIGNSSGVFGEAIWNAGVFTLTNTCISDDGDGAIYDHEGNTYDDIPACPTE